MTTPSMFSLWILILSLAELSSSWMVTIAAEALPRMELELDRWRVRSITTPDDMVVVCV